MSFWSETHPSYDKYQILWDKHVPGIGECSNTTAEAFRLVSGVYYQLHNNGSWFGTSNYHAKLYEKQGLCSPASDFMYNLNMDYSDEYDSDEYYDEEVDPNAEKPSSAVPLSNRFPVPPPEAPKEEEYEYY